MSGVIRLLLVDDHFFVRMGLAASLGSEEDMEVAGEAGGVAEAVARFRELEPDVVLLDGQLSDGHGLEVLEAIRSQSPQARVLMLSVEDAEESVFRAMDAGACGYLLKSTPRQVLLKAVREVAGGGRFLSEEVERLLRRRQERPELTERELQVLRLVARGEPNKIIAAELGIAEMTVKVHLSKVFAKLGVQDRTSAATAAVRRGLVSLDG